MSQMGPNSSAFVYVNGEKMNLLEDGRLALPPRFPEGAVLYDPSDIPPRMVPFSSDAAERGVTARRLIPYGHYEMYLPDPVTGDLHPLTGDNICVYVTNLPPNTSAEMLGRYFEAFDMVAEADIFSTASGACSGRGWVVLQDPAKLLLVPPVLEFFPRNFIRTALSDKIPSRATLQPASAQGSRAVNGGVPPSVEPLANRTSNNRLSNGMAGHSKASGCLPKPPAALAEGVLSAASYYFFASLSKVDAENSVELGLFWPSPPNRRAFYGALEKGSVIIIFVVHECSAIFGYARLLPPLKMDNNGSSGCPIKWLRHHVFLRESDMHGIKCVPIPRMGDGIPLKPELGESICQLADHHSSLPAPPDGFGHRHPNGRHVVRGGGVNNIAVEGGNSDDCANSMSDRGVSRPNVSAAAPPQHSLGARHFTRGGGHMTNGGNRMYPGRRAYHDNPHLHPPLAGNVPSRRM